VRLALKILRLKIIIVFLFAKVFSQSDFSINDSPLPLPVSPVMDYVGILDEATRKSLEKRLIEFRDSTNPSVEIAVCIVHTTGGRDIFEYSLAVARGWGIGSKEDDNPSLLLFIAFNDRKYFTQVSRDLEDELPDSLVGQIQRQFLVPAFRQQNYAKGITDTIEAYMTVIRQKQSGQSQANLSQEGQSNQEKRKSYFGPSTPFLTFFICAILPLIFFFMLFFSARKAYSRQKYGYRKSYDDSVSFPFPIIFWGGGSSGDSSWSNWNDDGGSSWGDWGGFGGGGDFGGGGAGGDW
jgi:uncharacterized protein